MSLIAMEPLFPNVELLRSRAAELVREAADVGRHLHPATLEAVTELLRTINCYYSNLIEGHDTHPIAIERAMAGELSAESATRDLQVEAKAHIEAQRAIEARMSHEPALNVCEPAFIRWIHEEFYRRMPAEFTVVRNPDGSREELVIPGALRHFDVRVGQHVAPDSAELEILLQRFATVYDPAVHLARDPTGALALTVLGAAHHRLLWVHPFGDGNGRVTRLMTDAYLRRAGVGVHGLWTLSRGLARARVRYKGELAAADELRRNDYDGRGPLSQRGLDAFCTFFLEICLDQIRYMSGILAVDRLTERFSAYCRAREGGLLSEAEASPGPGRPRIGFRPEATRLLRTMLAQGPIRREQVEDITGLADRTGRRMVRALLDEGLIASETPRAPLRLRFPAHVAPYVFPGLYGSGLA
jgi:Fic family protein